MLHEWVACNHLPYKKSYESAMIGELTAWTKEVRHGMDSELLESR